MGLKHHAMPERKEGSQTNGGARPEGCRSQTKSAPSGQTSNNLRNKINNVVVDYNPKYNIFTLYVNYMSIKLAK